MFSSSLAQSLPSIFSNDGSETVEGVLPDLYKPGCKICCVETGGFSKTPDSTGQPHVDHESIQVKPPGEQTKGFGGTRVCVTLGGILFLVHLLNHIGANFLAGAQRFL